MRHRYEFDHRAFCQSQSCAWFHSPSLHSRTSNFQTTKKMLFRLYDNVQNLNVSLN